MSAQILPYWDFDSQRDAPLTCPSCGWVGPAKGYEDVHDDLFDVCCPECDCMILIPSRRLPRLGPPPVRATSAND
jgi:predicted RNA-binding Zn-ribbon protein involved in translation (DUF1610 family)